jgi:hypothetical protein
MKKIILFIIAGFGIAGAAFYLTHLSPIDTIGNEYYADYLPEDTIFTLNLLDLEGVSEHFPQSDLGRFTSKPAMHEIMKELGANGEDIQKYDDLYDGIADVMTNPALQQIFGDDAVLALCPPNPLRLEEDTEQEFKNALLAFGTSSAAGPIEKFARIVMSKDFTNDHISGLDMTRIRLDENEILYGYSKSGIVLLAYDPERIVTAVKQKATGKTLTDSAHFATTKKFWTEADSGHVFAQSYFNIKRFQTLLAAFNQNVIKDAAAYLDGFKHAGGLIVDHQGELQITTKAEYEFAALNESIKKQYQSLPENNLSLSQLTEKTLLYYWFSSMDKELIRSLFSTAEAKRQYSLFDSMVQKELGQPLEQIIAALGPQVGIFVHEIVNAGMFPLPKTVLFFQIQDRKRVQRVLGKLRKKIAKQSFKEKSEKINGHTVYFWSVMPIEATHLAIALSDDMLYIANGESSLKSLLADERDTTVLSENMVNVLGSNIGQDISSANYYTFVLRPAQLAAQAEEAADWLSQMLLASKNVSTKRLREETLNLMRSFDVVAASGDIEKDYALSTVVFKKVKTTKQEKQ